MKVAIETMGAIKAACATAGLVILLLALGPLLTMKPVGAGERSDGRGGRLTDLHDTSNTVCDVAEVSVG